MLIVLLMNQSHFHRKNTSLAIRDSKLISVVSALASGGPQVFGVISIIIIIHYEAESLIGELKASKERNALRLASDDG